MFTDDDSAPSLPRYRIMADALRAHILSGEHAVGDRLPSETDLARSYGVSRGTAVKAIDQLVAEGIVHKRQGAGSFVALPPLRRRSARLLSFTETVDAMGSIATQSVLSFGPAPPNRLRVLGIVEPAVELRRLRHVDGVACAIHGSIIPQRVFNRLDSADLGRLMQDGKSKFSLYTAFERAGIVLDHGSETISARLATSPEARLLQIARVAALMVVVRQSFDAAGALIEVTEALYHADFLTYDLDLERRTPNAAPQRPRLAENNTTGVKGEN